MDDDIDDFLAHYGVKGMKWGVRRTGSGAGSFSGGSEKKPVSDNYRAAIDKFYASKTDAELNAEGRKKLSAQAQQTFPEEKVSGLSTRQKVLIGVGAAVVVGGLAYYGHTKLKSDSFEDLVKKHEEDVAAGITSTNKSSGPLSKKQRKEYEAMLKAEEAFNEKLVKEAEKEHAALVAPKKDFYKKNKEQLDANQSATESEWAGLFGNKPTFSDPTGVHPQQTSAFFPGLTSKKALDRPEFTIPKSTVFQRLSNSKETGEGYSSGAYSSFLTNDKKSYGSSSEFATSAYTINFTPKKDVRVPSLGTVLKTLSDSEHARTGVRLSADDTFAIYHDMSGGGWKDDKSRKLISSLKKQGYSALVDDMDAGAIGDLPVVFFGETEKVKARSRSSSDYKADKNSILPLIKQYA